MENDVDSARIMKALHSTPFEGPIEAYEMDDEISEEEVDAFEEKLDAFHSQPITDENYLRFKTEMQEELGIGVLIKQ